VFLGASQTREDGILKTDDLASTLKETAKELRKTALTMIHAAKSGHPGGSLSAADIMTALYFNELKLDPKNPKWEGRDRFVLSKGHVCPILYSALIMRGFMDSKEIYNLRKFGSLLQGHPDMKSTPGVDISTGSLGQGLSTAVGMALGLKRDGLPNRVFSMVGDGETNEGQVWEASMTAVKYKLDNLVLFVDGNGIQNDSFCNEIMPLQDLQEKFKAFGFSTFRINGHRMEEILAVLDEIRNNETGRPVAIIADTVKGRGVSFMEHVPAWHGMAPNDAQLAQATLEIEGGLK
jgi:transketolase